MFSKLIQVCEKYCDFEKQAMFSKTQNHKNTFRNYTISKVYQKSKYFSFLYKREKTEFTIRKSMESLEQDCETRAVLRKLSNFVFQ